MNSLNISEIKQLLKSAVKKLYDVDYTVLQAGERAIAFRLAFAIHQTLCTTHKKMQIDDLIIDCEYDKNLDITKEVYSSCSSCNKIKKKCTRAENKKKYAFFPNKTKVTLSEYMRKSYVSSRPDIVLHSRNNNNNNTLVIEVKKQASTSTVGKLKDKAKLSYFTCPRGPYKYKLGAFVTIGPDQTSIEWYSQGENVGKININKN